MAISEWDGKPACAGWHWLLRRRDGKPRMGFYQRANSWRIADAAGRTVCSSESRTARLFTYCEAIPEPRAAMRTGPHSFEEMMASEIPLSERCPVCHHDYKNGDTCPATMGGCPMGGDF